MTYTNQTPFAKLLGDYVANKLKAEGISANLLVEAAKLTTFDTEWLCAYHTATGKDKTAILNNFLAEVYPDFTELFETASLKKKEISSQKLVQKQDAQKQLHSITIIMREAMFGLAYFRLNETSDWKVEKKRIKFVIDGAWNSDTGDTFDDVVRKGRKACEKEGWVSAPSSAGKTKGNGNNGTSVAETFASVTPETLPALAGDVLKHVRLYLEALDFNTVSESVQSELVKIEKLLIVKTYGSTNGQIDFEAIQAVYDGQQTVSEAA